MVGDTVVSARRNEGGVVGNADVLFAIVDHSDGCRGQRLIFTDFFAMEKIPIRWHVRTLAGRLRIINVRVRRIVIRKSVTHIRQIRADAHHTGHRVGIEEKIT